jgi:hypothetical protein
VINEKGLLRAWRWHHEGFEEAWERHGGGIEMAS